MNRHRMAYPPQRSRPRDWTGGYTAASAVPLMDELSSMMVAHMFPRSVQVVVLRPQQSDLEFLGASPVMGCPLPLDAAEWPRPVHPSHPGQPVYPDEASGGPFPAPNAFFPRVLSFPADGIARAGSRRDAAARRDAAIDADIVEAAGEPESAPQTGAAPAAASPFQKLSPEGGWRRAVRWGEFHLLLNGKIAHPERLRPSHRLGCQVDVYEVLARLDRRDLERILNQCDRRPVRLERLTPGLAQRLDLTGVLPRPQRPPYAGPRREGDVLPFERYVELRVVDDPTRRAESAPGGGSAGVGVGASVQGGQSTPSRGKAEIPGHWVKPWEFRLSREEVIYDMNAERSWWNRVVRAVGRVTAAFSHRAALAKWQALLTGRTLDEQLWGVRPPRVALSHSRIRRRIVQVLAAAGYDPAPMLAEWEIFWRRKGV